MVYDAWTGVSINYNLVKKTNECTQKNTWAYTQKLTRAQKPVYKS